MRHQKTRSRELLELCARMSQWRKKDGGGRGSRITEELWQEALGAARIDGLYATAKAARLNYDRLKERSRAADKDKAPAAGVGEKHHARVVRTSRKKQDLLAGTSGSRRIDPAHVGDQGGPRFVALQMAQLPTARLTTIELMGQNGDRMRVEVSGALDVVDLVQTLWSRPS